MISKIGLATNTYLITLSCSFISSQRKLSAPEYKNVNEEHRVAMIKHETTQMAVRDLDKYHSAVDKVRRSFVTLYEREGSLTSPAFIKSWRRRCFVSTALRLAKSIRSSVTYGILRTRARTSRISKSSLGRTQDRAPQDHTTIAL